MLYNPQWEARKAVEANQFPLILASFTAWLEQQPSHGWYDPTNIPRCALTQWLRAIGAPDSWVKLYSASIGARDPFQYIILTDPPTFGGALARAKQVAQ